MLPSFLIFDFLDCDLLGYWLWKKQHNCAYTELDLSIRVHKYSSSVNPQDQINGGLSAVIRSIFPPDLIKFDELQILDSVTIAG
jgi:hypothetical protein